jgi:hypothetical protein
MQRYKKEFRRNMSKLERKKLPTVNVVCSYLPAPQNTFLKRISHHVRRI